MGVFGSLLRSAGRLRLLRHNTRGQAPSVSFAAAVLSQNFFYTFGKNSGMPVHLDNTIEDNPICLVFLLLFPSLAELLFSFLVEKNLTVLSF